MRKLSYSLFMICLMAQGLMAQDLLVKTNGDTLTGKVDIAKDHRNREYAFFRNGRKKESVKPLQVRMIQKESGEIIRPVQVGDQFKFGKQVEQGYLSYYKVSNDDVVELFTSDLLTKMDGSSLLLQGKIGFRGRVGKFLEDCFDVSLAVKEKKYTRRELDQVVKDYNACVNTSGLSSGDAAALKADVINLSGDLEQNLADFGSQLANSSKVANKEDVTAMFNDVAGKIRRKELVPNYLKTALQEAIKDDDELKRLMKEILKNVK